METLPVEYQEGAPNHKMTRMSVAFALPRARSRLTAGRVGGGASWKRCVNLRLRAFATEGWPLPAHRLRDVRSTLMSVHRTLIRARLTHPYGSYAVASDR